MKKSRVVLVRGKGVLTAAGEPIREKLLAMYQKGFQALLGTADIGEGLGLLFRRADRVGIKVNTIGGKKISTRPEASLTLADILTKGGVEEKNILIWDRTIGELRDAGYSLNLVRSGCRVFGTDALGAGYSTELTSHLNIGSLFSTIQRDWASASISLAILKDHGLAGITAGMKNYFGAIHNPNKYHDSRCDPFIAELFDCPSIRTKHRLTILDCLIIQYHRGPAYHSRWAEREESLIISRDPVAADFAGWQLVEKIRARRGLPSLEEENREPLYLLTAAKMGLGKADRDAIEMIELEA